MAQQSSLIKTYFKELRVELDQFMIEIEKETLTKLQSDQAESFKAVKKARISKNYVDIPQSIFKMLLQVYEGTPFSEMFKNSEGGKIEEAYHYT